MIMFNVLRQSQSLCVIIESYLTRIFRTRFTVSLMEDSAVPDTGLLQRFLKIVVVPIVLMRSP